jgi:hypothetical protein
MSYALHDNILHDNQFGFRSQYLTGHAILSIVDKIQQAIEKTILLWDFPGF